MNTRSTPKRKSAGYRKAKLKNEEAEVFVLPPNLLEKLGIKLDKIQSTENSSTDPKNTIDLSVNYKQDHQENLNNTYVNTNKPCNNESESSILETASLMKKSVFLSPTFVSTMANMIPGEVELASVRKECKNNNENPIQGPVNNKSFPVPLSAEQQLFNEFVSVNTAHNDPSKSIQFNDNCLSAMRDNCEYSTTPSISDCTAKDNMHNGRSPQEYLNRESQNITVKPNENQENEKRKIKIINNEIIDIAKINKLLNFDNNNVLTPVTVGMLLPPTKVFSNSKLKVSESGSNQSHRKETNCIEAKKCESNCEYVEYMGGDIDVHNAYADVTQVLTTTNSTNVEKNVEAFAPKNKQLNNTELCVYTSNLLHVAAENLGNVAAELKKDTGSNIISVVNCVNIIQDQNSKDFPVFSESVVSPEVSTDVATELKKDNGSNIISIDNGVDVIEDYNSQDFPVFLESVVSPEVSTDVATGLKKGSNIVSSDNCVHIIQDHNSQDFPVFSESVVSSEVSTDLQQNESTNFGVKSQICSTKIQNTISKENYSSLPKKKDACECNASCNNMANDNICSDEQNNYWCSVETTCTSASNEIKNDAENGLTISKLCIQGVEKPGGQSKPKSSIVKVYCNKQKVNKPKPDTRNKKQTVDKEPKINQTENNPQENAKVMKSPKTYKGKNKFEKDLIQNSRNETDLSTKMSEASKHQINDIVLDTSYKNTEYCLCSDFGQLKYYDEVSFYEHIHFWQRNNVLCDIDTIFSMYVDKVTTKEHDVNKSVEALNESPEESWHKICWNEMYDEEEVRDKFNLNIVSEEFKSLTSNIKKNNEDSHEEKHIIDVEMKERDNNNITKKSNEGTKSEDWTTPNSSIMSTSEWIKEDAVKARNLKNLEDANKVVNIKKVQAENKAADASKVENAKARDTNRPADTFKVGAANKVKDANKAENANKAVDASKGGDASKVENAKARDTNKTVDTIKVGAASKVKDTNKVENANKAGVASKGGDANKVENVKDRYTSRAGDTNKVGDANKVKDVNTKTGKKRKRSIRDAKEENESSLDNFEPLSKRDIKCGVCGQILAKRDWEEHSNKEHGFIAWKVGDIFDIEDKKVMIKVKQKFKDDGVLKCTFCNVNLNCCEEYLSHVKECIKSESSCSSHASNTPPSGTIMKPKKTRLSNIIECGVCEQDIQNSDWIAHIRQEHSYIAWEKGETPLDINNEGQIIKHLRNIIRGYGPLVCFKCAGLQYGIKSIKTYLEHLKFCNEVEGNTAKTEPFKKMDIDAANTSTHLVEKQAVKCDDSPKKIEIKTGTLKEDFIEQKSLNCDSAKEYNIELDTITTPVEDKSCKRGSCYKIAGKGKAVKCGDSPKKMNIDTEITLIPPPAKEKTMKHCDTREKIDLNTEVISTPLVKGKSVRRGSHKKIDINIESTLTPLAKEKSSKSDDSPFKGDNNEIYTSTPLIKESVVKCGNYSKKVDMDTGSNSTSTAKEVTIKCGVCKEEMESNLWNDHIQKVHDYLAWKEGESPLDPQNNEQIWHHLHSISKKCGGLVCAKCGVIRKYAKAFLSHIKQCDGMDNSGEADTSLNVNIHDESTTANSETVKRGDFSPEVNDTTEGTLTTPAKEKTEKCVYSPIKENKDSDTNLTLLAGKVAVKCGVCKHEIEDCLWNDHMHKAHDYLAWKEGESSLDLQDKDQIRQHLHSISKKCDGLVCSKCGLNRKYVKAYLSHIKRCDGMRDSTEADSSKNMNIDIATSSSPLGEETVKCGDSVIKVENDSGTTLIPSAEQVVLKCGVCKQEMDHSLWNEHMQKAHNYLAWIEGESPLDLQDKDQIWQHLYSISKKCDGLVCSKCGINRKYVKAYLSHTKQCDGMNYSTEAVSEKNVDIEIATTSTTLGKDEIAEYSETSQELNTGSTDTPSVIKKSVQCGDSAMEGDDDSELIPLAEQVVVKCGVCKQEMVYSLWNDHIQKEHNYLAWREGESSLDLKDKEQIWQHLHSISKKCNGLVCSKCGVNRKYPKAYLSHIKQCDGMNPNNESLLSSSMDTSCLTEVNTSQSDNYEKCGVCSELCLNRDWIMHIGSKHDYLAWKEGEPQLNLQDQEAIENHLRKIVKKQDTLHCRNCGEDRKYGARTVYKYLQHIKSCGKNVETEIEDSVVVKCGVCEQDVEDANWIEHIGIKHNYLAWKHGEEPLELENTEKVKLHLFKLLKEVDALKCSKCGVAKKYPKVFLDHIDTCDATASIDTSRLQDTDGLTECAVCSEKLDPKVWRNHAIEKHYNVAWRTGDYPIDVKSPYVVEKYLKEYKQIVGQLVCKVCGISRASLIGFYAHVVVCGKSEEEAEKFQSTCEVCNKTYVGVYKNQHMTAHAQQEYAKERKMHSLEKQKEDQEKVTETGDTTGVENHPQGRRRAAVKARDHIEKLKTDEDDDPKICTTCGFEASTARKLDRHKCVTVTFESGSETEDSYESGESDASAESKLETEVSEEDEKEYLSSKKRYKESIVTAKVPKVPFQYQKLNRHTMRTEDFFEKHFTDEILFPEWLASKYEHLEDNQLIDYSPKVEQSCKIKLDEKWDTFKRFQVKKYNKGCSMFVGGAVQCLSWVPLRLNDDDQSDNYLSVSCHMNADVPRYEFDELSTHSAVIQIWNFSTFRGALPKLALCIAHDYGTVWAMDWCPSGARAAVADDDKCSRLGLLAVACSNGFVYIFSVPFPSSIAESDKVFCKLKPVAELRISMSSERKPYQATAISWSKQKGHAVVMVGYVDGTTALYDLCSTSPLLKCVENGVTVFYPYHDRRDHNTCITDVDICPGAGADGRSTVGAVCSASVTGTALLRARAGLPRVDGRSPSTACRFTPGWPSVLFAADDIIALQSLNELDWYGCGRRLGPVRTFCTCQHCSRVLVYIRPLIRYMDALPPYTDFKKQSIALIKTSPLAKKRKIENDELAMLVEPLTYDDVVTQYGVEVIVDSNEKNPAINSLREPFSERFPLSDVTAMAFCPSARHHRVAAVGLQAGFVIVLTV